MPERTRFEAIPAFQTNYVWALHNGRDCALVDPGSAAEPLTFLVEKGLRLCAVLLTHHHADHIGGVDEIIARHPVPVWGPTDPRIPRVDHAVAEGDVARVPELGLELAVLETPGHTSSHIVFHDESALLAGDTLFSIGCGRLFEGSAEQMQRSLDKLAALPDQLRVYCAHEYTVDNCRFALAIEPDNRALQARAREARRLRAADQITLPSTLGDERAANPFLRTRVDSVIEAAQARAPEAGSDPASVFGVIRRWKDEF